ncbi:MAG: esterase/lipase family protein [Woeseiaceae bacterium]
MTKPRAKQPDAAMPADDLSPPSLLLALFEWPRAVSEASALIPSHPFLNNLPPGDGHAVMTLPGFLGTDNSLWLMRRYLRRWGYDARRWRLGRNTGLTRRRDIEKMLDQRLRALFGKSGGKVSLVGWSLGGVLARELARRNPQFVRTVITLGSPIGEPKATTIWRLYEYVSGISLQDRDIRKRIDSLQEPIPEVPLTAIYSNSDAIVSSQIAQVPPGEHVENIGVNTSHFGMGFNPAVFFALADRLRQPEGAWAPFEISGLRKLFYH